MLSVSPDLGRLRQRSQLQISLICSGWQPTSRVQNMHCSGRISEGLQCEQDVGMSVPCPHSVSLISHVDTLHDPREQPHCGQRHNPGYGSVI